ncbi:MAG: hypothetical protein WD342_09845 [Verrucomicrobiales bacterium]
MKFLPRLTTPCHLACIATIGLIAGSLRGEDADPRKGYPRTLHDYHPFRSVDAPEDWEARRSEIRDRVLLASGLLPLPEKTPLNPEIFGAVQRDGFKVERVYFESFPGHYVTGSLFSPTGETESRGLVDGKRPGVLCPHGHWKEGRFYDVANQGGEPAVLRHIANGAERFESAARNPIIARCVQLARMGCVVFAYDMLGYADSVQFEEHRRGPREAMNSPKTGEWGFVSPRATLRLQTNFGLQTWNSLRALDFVAELENVDPDRLMVTGASGGATQTMMLGAIDDRVDAAFPAVMASTAMQGGCTCENSHYLRIGQGNIDIAAAMAPRPLGLTAADDWTIELETKGHPDLVSLYESLNVPGHYEAHFNTHFKHNYNHVSRSQVYDFTNRHFGLGMKAPVLESDFEFLGPEELGVWSDPSRKPEKYLVGDEHEREVNRTWAEASDAGMTEEAARRGWELILQRGDEDSGEVRFELEDKVQGESFLTMTGPIRREKGTDIPARFYYPENWNGTVVVWLSRSGSGGLHGGDPLEPVKEVRASLDEGAAVMGLDFPDRSDNEAVTYSGKSDVPADSWQRSPVYFYGYNHSAFVRRVHDVLDAVEMIRSHPDWDAKKIVVAGEPGTAHWTLAAKLAGGGAIDRVEADAGDFRFGELDDVWHEDFVPGAVKYGDVEMLRKLAGADET